VRSVNDFVATFDSAARCEFPVHTGRLRGIIFRFLAHVLAHSDLCLKYPSKINMFGC
jgi:hypothetical protein